jgi:hypothetical protein
MENQNQHYGTHESMYVEDPNEQKQFLHSEEEEKPVVTGDPSETAEDHDLNQAAGMADVDDLLEEVDDEKGEPGPGDDDDDPDSDDPGLDDDDDFGLDDDDLDIDPDETDPDDLDLDDDDVIDNDLNTEDKDLGLDEDDDNATYLK